MNTPEILLLAVAAVLGGAAQSVLGFGAAFTTVPALAVVAPELIPGAALVSFLPLTAAMAVRERHHIDRAAFLRVALARVPGTLLGTAAVLVVSPDGLAAGVAVILLLAVLSAARGWTVPITSVSERTGGVISGFCGTAVGLGGPPLAVLYRSRPPQEMRSTLASVFAVGIVMSMAALGVSGSLTVRQIKVGGALAVAVISGLVVAAPMARRLPDAAIRGGLLVWAGAGSLVALVRVLLF